jgi:2Fe-2S ferredoxin
MGRLMPVRVRYIQPDGSERVVEANPGTSVMHAAIANSVPGIIGECGGSCMCATCHVRVGPDWLAQLPPISDTESEMLDFAASARLPESRLGCQITLQPELDGLTVRVPEAQV